MRMLNERVDKHNTRRKINSLERKQNVADIYNGVMTFDIIFETYPPLINRTYTLNFMCMN